MSDPTYFIDGDIFDTEKILKCLKFTNNTEVTSCMSYTIANHIITNIINPKIKEIKEKFINSLKEQDVIKIAKSLNVEKKFELFTHVIEKELE
jgi:hypothetical protein